MKLYIKRIDKNIKPTNIPTYLLEKINSYKSNNRKIESLNGYELLFTLLKKLNIEEEQLVYKNNGKPYLLNTNIYFNISHSNEYVVIGFSDNELGVDIEKVNKRIKKLKSKFYNKKFVSKNKLTKVWTMKEAYIKYYALNIIINLENIIITKKRRTNILTFNNESIKVKTFKYKNYYISIATNKKKIEVIYL